MTPRERAKDLWKRVDGLGVDRAEALIEAAFVEAAKKPEHLDVDPQAVYSAIVDRAGLVEAYDVGKKRNYTLLELVDYAFGMVIGEAEHDLKMAVKDEREQCAKLCDDSDEFILGTIIRARG